MDTTINPATADFSTLVAVLEQPVCNTDHSHRRIHWLLELASALDSLPFDGISDLANEARSKAARLIKSRVDSVAGR